MREKNRIVELFSDAKLRAKNANMYISLILTLLNAFARIQPQLHHIWYCAVHF